MSILKTLTLAVAVTGLVSTQVMATTITNKDRRAHSIFMEYKTAPSEIEGLSFSEQHQVPAGKSVKLPCSKSCDFRLAGSTASVKATGNGHAVIKGGKIAVQK